MLPGEVQLKLLYQLEQYDGYGQLKAYMCQVFSLLQWILLNEETNLCYSHHC